jgi:septum formation protein
MVRLILASTSPVRRLLLSQAGLTFEVARSPVEEIALKAGMPSAAPGDMAGKLAEAKAVAVANRIPEAIVIGADQVLAIGSEALDKPETIEVARRQLLRLRGREHRLETAVCCARGSTVLWRHHGRARLVMRSFSDAFLSDYLAQAGPDVTSSVGAYKLEGTGIQLFDAIEGDYFTILGLPLLPLLAFLRSEGVVAT